MPQCPFCEREINSLEVQMHVLEIGCLTANREIDWINSISGDGDDSYHCPECNEEITTNRGNAVDFLNKEEKTKEKPEKLINKIIEE